MPPPPPPANSHVVAFYETEGFLIQQAAAFIREGIFAGETVLVVATEAHQAAFAESCADTVGSGVVVRVDAHLLLDAITSNGRADVDRFRAALAAHVPPDRRCRIYGELVALLADRGDLDGAIAIEEVGHALAHDEGVRILCAYHTARVPLSDEDRMRVAGVHDVTVSEAPASTRDSRPLILLADDFEDALDMYGEYLRFSGFQVVLARDGEEAVRAARAHRPDLILMDIRMPRMTGAEALRVLRADPDFEQVPILALTAHALESERVAILADGFEAVIAKPCLPSNLVEHVRSALPQPGPWDPAYVPRVR